MFSASLGNFDFDDFYAPNNIKVRPWMACIIMIIFLIITSITLLNFVVAILANTYESIRSKSSAVYIMQMIDRDIA